MALSIEESALGHRIESAEKRAESRCKDYDKSNIHWKKVDELLGMQDDVLRRIHDLTKTMNEPINKVPISIDSQSPTNPHKRTRSNEGIDLFNI